MTSKDSDKVRESNLPLLFVKGNPTSLELMNLEELQVFLRFVIKCEGNRTEWPDLDEIEQPKWWPNGFEFSETIMMKQEKQRGKLSLLLKNAIRQCYTFHECAFLIDFCRQLIVYTGGVENLDEEAKTAEDDEDADDLDADEEDDIPEDEDEEAKTAEDDEDADDLDADEEDD